MGFTSDVRNWAFGNVDISGYAADSKGGNASDHAGKIISVLGQVRLRETWSVSSAVKNLSGQYGVNIDDLQEVVSGAIETSAKGVKKGIKAADISSTVRQKAAELTQGAKDLVAAIRQWVRDLWQKCIDWLGENVRKYANVIGVAVAKEVMELLGFITASIADIVATSVAAAAPAVGYVSDGLSMATGLWSSAKNSWAFGKMEYHRNHFEVFNGAPSLIVKALERHYATRVASGLFKAGKGMASTAIRATGDSAFGAGAIAGLVIGCVDAVYHFADRCIERIFLNCTLSTAKKAHQSDYKSLTTDYGAFNRWFSGQLMLSPVLAAVVLRAVYHDNADGFVEATSTPTSAKKQLKRLEKHAGAYLQQHRSEYWVEFASDDPVIKQHLRKGYH